MPPARCAPRTCGRCSGLPTARASSTCSSADARRHRRGARRAARAIRHRRRSGGGAVRSCRVHAFRHAREDRARGRRRSVARRGRAHARARFAAALSMRVLSRTWQMLLKGIAEVQARGRPLAAAEMVLVRIAYAADLPTPDEVIRAIGNGSGAQRCASARPGNGGASARRRLRAAIEAPRGAPRAAPAPRARHPRRSGTDAARRRSGQRSRSIAFEDAHRARGREARHLHASSRSNATCGSCVARTASSRSRSSRARAKDPRARSAAQAHRWTGQRWMVVVSRRAGRSRRLREQAERRAPSWSSGVRADPLVQGGAGAFPGAEIVGVHAQRCAPPRRGQCADEQAARYAGTDMTMTI